MVLLEAWLAEEMSCVRAATVLASVPSFFETHAIEGILLQDVFTEELEKNAENFSPEKFGGWQCR